MGVMNSLFGFRWSLYLVNNNNIHYAMHEHSPIRMVGYCMSYFKGGNTPSPPWRLFLNFNKKHQLIELGPQHFTSDGQDITTQLMNEITAIDPDFRVKSGEPVFENAITKKKLKINEFDGLSIEDMVASIGKPHEESFGSVMDSIFQKDA